MKKSDICRFFVSASAFFCLGIALALPLNTTELSPGTRRGVDGGNHKIQCSFNLGGIRRSPSNKRYRSMIFSHNGNNWNLIDFEPRERIALRHYNPQGFYGYDVWARSYGDESYFVRLWMNYQQSKRIPATAQLFAVSKKTGITRILGDCAYLK